MFLPQVVTAIVASVLGVSLARRFGTKQVYLAGLVANLASMALLIVSQFFTTDQAVAYGLLLGATACLGAGFGLTAPALNSFTAVFHPAAVDRSILVLNALLGLGTALAPVFVAIFDGLGFWWGLPLLSAALLAGLLAMSLPLPLYAGAQARGAGRSMAGIPARFWVFGAFAVLYGICETMNGNWAQLDMTRQLGGVHHPGGARPHHLLGHGHRRPGPVRPRPAVAPDEDHLPSPAVRAGRPGLLGAAAPHHQLRPGGAGGDVGLAAIFGCTAVAAVVLGGLSFVLTARQIAPSPTGA